MAIEEGLVTLLRATSSVTSLLGTPVTKTCCIDILEQGIDGPYVSVTLISTDNNNTLESRNGMRTAELDIDCVSVNSKPRANAIADAIEALLDTYTGTAGDHSISAVILNDRGSDKIDLGQGDARFKYVTTVNCDIQYTS